MLAATQGIEQVMSLLEVRAELEHAEDPQHPDHPDDQQVLGIAVVQREDAGHDGQQVHQPIETEGVAQGLGRAVQAQDVLAEEDRREAPLDVRQQAGVVLVNVIDAVQNHDYQAGEDDQQQGGVEASTGDGVGLENNHVQAISPRVVADHAHRLGRKSAQPRLILPGSARRAFDCGFAEHLNNTANQPAGKNERRGQGGQTDGGKQRRQQQRQADANQRQPRLATLRAEGEGGQHGVIATEAEQCGIEIVVQQAPAHARD
ncbi:hypothetical protein D9M69_499780 [compost metagenome]